MKKQNRIGLEPMPGRIIVRREEAMEKSTGGIILPDSAKECLNRGVVLAVGAGLLPDEKTTVQEGDTVFFPQYNVQSIITDDGEELLIVHASDLLVKSIR